MDYNEALCEAVDIIVTKRLAELRFDRTVIGTIVDNSKAEDGLYRVQIDGTICDAYSDDERLYKKDQQVRIQIPQNDMTQRKIILGRNITEEDEAIHYVAPGATLSTFGAPGFSNSRTYSLKATNDSEMKTVEILSSTNITEPTIQYNALKVSADFKALFSTLKITDGNYGIWVILKDEDDGLWRLDLNNKNDMFGPIYNFTSYSKQTQVYSLELEKNITQISAVFYQGGDFKGLSEDIDESLKFDELWIRNFEVQFAYEAALIDDNNVTIHSSTINKIYNKEEGDTSKEVTLIYYNKNEHNEFLGFDDGVFDNRAFFDIQACVNKLSDDKTTTEEINNILIELYSTGGFLEGLEQPANDPGYKKTIDHLNNPPAVYYGIEWLSNRFDGTYDTVFTTDTTGEAPGLGEEQRQRVTLQCNPNYDRNEFHAAVWRSGSRYSSNTIEYKSHIRKSNETRYNIKGVIKYDLNHYAVYGASGTILSSNEAKQSRRVTFGYEWTGTTLGAQTIDMSNWTYQWSVPDTLTMLIPPTDPTNFTKQQFTYRIKESYNPAWKNNKITCVATDPLGNQYHAELDITFSAFGSSGTDYTFIITEKNGLPAYTAGQTEPKYELQAILYDKEGKEIGEKIDILVDVLQAKEYNAAKTSTQVNWLGNVITLLCEYPIPWRSDVKYQAEAPFEIVYNANYAEPMYYKGPLKLYKNETEVTDVKWSLELVDAVEGQRVSGLSLNKNSIAAVDILTQDMLEQKVILCATIGNTVVWTQPILIHLNSYQFDKLNNWDGKMQIDKEGNYILTSMVTAGRKNSDNTFTGVVMGEVGKLDGSSSEIGLFGLGKGTRSFFINADTGDASFTGNIHMTGGTISWKSDANPEGVDFPEGSSYTDEDVGEVISNWGLTEINGNHVMSPNIIGGSLHIVNKDKTIEAKITSDGKLTCTGAEITGTIRANTGYIGGENGWQITSQRIQATNNGYYYNINTQHLGSSSVVLGIKDNSSDEYPFQVTGQGHVYCSGLHVTGGTINIDGTKASFGLSNTGVLTCTGANITGTITAESGNIGGWNVSTERLSYGNSSTNYFQIYPSRIGTNQIVMGIKYGGNYNFQITGAGKLTCKEASIEGEITATEGGNIGGWVIQDEKLYSKPILVEMGNNSRWNQTAYLSPEGVYLEAEHVSGPEPVTGKNINTFVAWKDILRV